jgi:hypothetical protein
MSFDKRISNDHHGFMKQQQRPPGNIPADRCFFFDIIYFQVTRRITSCRFGGSEDSFQTEKENMKASLIVIFLILVFTTGSLLGQDTLSRGVAETHSLHLRSALLAGGGFFALDEGGAGYYDVLFRLTSDPLPLADRLGFMPQISVGAGNYFGEKAFGVLELDAGGSLLINDRVCLPLGFSYRSPFGSKTPILGPAGMSQGVWNAKMTGDRIFLFLGAGWKYTNVFWEVRWLECIGDQSGARNYYTLEFHLGILL